MPHLHQLFDVLFPSFLFGRAFHGVPRVPKFNQAREGPRHDASRMAWDAPLGIAREVEHSRPVGVHIADRGWMKDRAHFSDCQQESLMAINLVCSTCRTKNHISRLDVVR